MHVFLTIIVDHSIKTFVINMVDSRVG